MKGAVSEKGQVTIPKRIRARLGITGGTIIEFSERNGALVGRKIVPGTDPVQAVTGIVKLDGGVDSYIAGFRGEEAE
jgi:AbrB family looped-hinge helix DNA binding protein